MSTSVDLQPGEPSWLPVESCTLPTAAQPFRLAEFDDLFADALTGVQRLSGDHVRLVLAGPTGLRGRVQDLADRETACCSFFTFTITTTADYSTTVSVDINVPTHRVDVLTVLADRAEGHVQREDRS